MNQARFVEARALRRLEALDRAKRDVVSALGHELRTPLAGMLGYTELLRDGDVGPLNTEQRSLLACVERNGARLSTLIDELIDVARVQAEDVAHPADRVDDNDVGLRAVGSCEPAPTRRATDLEPAERLHAPADHGLVEGTG